MPHSSQSGPGPSTPPGDATGLGCARLVLLAAVALLLICCVLPAVLTQGLPDPLFRTSITYTPQQGPTNPLLLDSRPERIVLRYVADYLSVAGTYPCAQDLSQYAELDDPVLADQPCHIRQPVASYAVTSVTIRTRGVLGGAPEAVVILVVHYTDDQQWTHSFGLYPDRYQNLLGIHVHLDCWFTFETLAMFGDLVADIPPGADYSQPNGLVHYCKDYAGRIVPVGDRQENAPVAGLGAEGARLARQRAAERA
jgi:hypothetical protein